MGMKLEDLYDMIEQGRTHAAIDLLFESVDGLMHDGKFSDVDRLLDDVDLARLDDNLIVGFLAITRSARDKLERRDAFVTNAASFITASKMENLR